MKIAMLLGALCLSASRAASTEEPEVPMFSLSGFGTLGVVHSSEDQADFGASVFIPHGAGHTRQWSPEVDSRIGAQLTAHFTPRLSATVQLISEQRHDGQYWPHVEWANIKYQLTPQLSVRLGRTALASFLVSDVRKVGYANPWVRPPAEVYGLMPVGNSDGVDVSYKLQIGRVRHTLLGSYGQTTVRDVDGVTSKGRDQWVISDTAEYGAVTLRVAFQQLHLDSEESGLFRAIRQFGPEGVALAERYDPNGAQVTFVGAGVMYDPGHWFLMAEWGNSNFRSAIGERTAWYASAGYRIGAVTPFATFAKARARSRTSDPGLTVTGLPPAQAGTAIALNAGLNGFLGSIPVQQGISAGARWDFMPKVALKMQYDHNRLGAGSPGSLGNLQSDFTTGGTFDLVSLSVDFVW
jgi:hypothetical protein